MNRKHVSELSFEPAIKLGILHALLVVTVQIVYAVEPMPPGVVPPPGAPPPPGSGNFPPPLVDGDPAGARLNPPTGRADRNSGNRFPNQPERVRNPNNFARYQMNNGSGVRMVLPDRAPELGPGTNTNDEQLEQIQQRQYPYVGFSLNGPLYRRRIVTPTETRTVPVPSKRVWSDRPGGAPRTQQNNQVWRTLEQQRAPIPTVQLFSRMLVIAGVVFATVFMAFAAFSVVLGHPHGGQRVIGASAGLMLLLMAYSIYKVVMINAFRFPNAATVTITQLDPSARRDLLPANTPATPAEAPPAAPRSNLRVRPFDNAQNP